MPSFKKPYPWNGGAKNGFVPPATAVASFPAPGQRNSDSWTRVFYFIMHCFRSQNDLAIEGSELPLPQFIYQVSRQCWRIQLTSSYLNICGLVVLLHSLAQGFPTVQYYIGLYYNLGCGLTIKTMQIQGPVSIELKAELRPHMQRINTMCIRL